jgi:predicted PurR-regulated permease PerM
VLTVIVAALALVAAAVSFLIPAVIKSGKELISQVPAIYEYMVGLIRNLGFDFDSASIMNYISMDKILEVLDFSNANKYIQRVAGAGSVLFDLLMSVIISIYILTDRDALRKGVKRLFSLFIKKDTRQLVAPYVRLTCGYMYKYFGCLLLDAMVVFLLSLVVMLIVRVKYAPLLALMMGLFNIIPYFGAIISVVLIVIITLVTGSASQAVITAICLIVLQQIDANIIQPYIVKDSLQIKPFWVLVAILLGGGLFGFVGVIIAVPIMAMLLTVAGDIMDARERRLGENNNNEY